MVDSGNQLSRGDRTVPGLIESLPLRLDLVSGRGAFWPGVDALTRAVLLTGRLGWVVPSWACVDNISMRSRLRQ